MVVQERREERKYQLKNIALKLFALDGYEKTRVSSIVKEAGLSQGSFYWYFESKEDCALEMLEDGKKRFLEAIKSGYRTESFTIEDAKQSTRDMFMHIIHFAQEQPYLVQLLLRGLHSEPILQEKIMEIKCTIEHQFELNLVQAKELEILPSQVNCKFQAAMIMSLLEGLLARILFKEYSDDYIIQQQPIEQIVDHFVRFEFFGLFGEKGHLA